MNLHRCFFLSANLALLLIFYCYSGFPADDKNKTEQRKENILKLLSLTKTPEIYVKTMLDVIEKSPLSSEDKELYSKYATSESLAEAFVPVYQETFTDEEINAMISFYSSKAGISIVEKTFDAAERLRTINFEWETSISRKIKSEKAQKATGK